MRRGAPLALLLTTLLLGCGGQEAERTATLPSCAQAGPAVAHAGLPEQFPLPPGSVLTSDSGPSSGARVVGGLGPLPFRDAVAFFREDLPRAGYRLGEGDAEQDEAESTFFGHGIVGKWRVNGILGCPDAVRITIAIRGN